MKNNIICQARHFSHVTVHADVAVAFVAAAVVVDLVTSPTDLLDPPLKKGWDTGQLLHSNAGGLPRGTSSSSQRPTVQCSAQRGPDTPGEERKGAGHYALAVSQP